MKQVSIVYANSYNPEAMDFVRQSLEDVFAGYVSFSICYLDTFDETTLLHADAYLAANEVPFQTLKNYVSDYTTIIRVTRSPDRSALQMLADIPEGSNVLLVNDGYENALETVASFNEAGVGHITLIPYDRHLAHTGIYDQLTIAVTPDEVDLVPPHIKEIINIGYRKVSFETMYRLMKLLDLDMDVINRNLFQHIRSVVEANVAFQDNFINSYLKSQLLNHFANKMQGATLLLDSQYRVVHANSKASALFQVSDMTRLDIRKFISPELLTDTDTPADPIEILGQNYYYDKTAFSLMDETAGYYITLQDEADMSLAVKQNQEKGYIAKYQFKDIVHNAPAMDAVITKAQQIAPTDYTVLIRGESGTGKELMAQSIHNASFRNRAPFVAINCAALPENLLESELFGYDSGAFTGAKSKGKVGLFEQANHGTLFLDEIGDLSPQLQAHLLRAIQEKQIMRLGSDRLVDVDIRLITATNKDLESEVKSGSFRSDLFFRLNVLPLEMPPLRQRTEDIPSLMEYFLGSAYRNVTQEELHILMSYSWPGNVRELENVAIYYNALSSLPDYLYQHTVGTQSSSGAAQDIEQVLLGIIASSTAVSHGIGRSAVLHILKGQNIDISDGKLRELFADLEARGLVEIGKGRSGTRITAAGRERLAR